MSKGLECFQKNGIFDCKGLDGTPYDCRKSLADPNRIMAQVTFECSMSENKEKCERRSGSGSNIDYYCLSLKKFCDRTTKAIREINDLLSKMMVYGNDISLFKESWLKQVWDYLDHLFSILEHRSGRELDSVCDLDKLLDDLVKGFMNIQVQSEAIFKGDRGYYRFNSKEYYSKKERLDRSVGRRKNNALCEAFTDKLSDTVSNLLLAKIERPFYFGIFADYHWNMNFYEKSRLANENKAKILKGERDRDRLLLDYKRMGQKSDMEPCNRGLLYQLFVDGGIRFESGDFEKYFIRRPDINVHKLDTLLKDIAKTGRTHGDVNKDYLFLLEMMRRERNDYGCIYSVEYEHLVKEEGSVYAEADDIIIYTNEEGKKHFVNEEEERKIRKNFKTKWYDAGNYVIIPKKGLNRTYCKGKRLIVINVNLYFQNEGMMPHEERKFGAHRNMMIIDLKTKTIERFEPNGPGVSFYDIYKVDNMLEKVLKDEMPNFKYEGPGKVCPRLKWGVQAEQKHIGEGGYCVTWSTMYAYYRLMHPDVSPSDMNRAMMYKDYGKGERFSGEELLERVQKFQQLIDETISDDYVNRIFNRGCLRSDDENYYTYLHTINNYLDNIFGTGGPNALDEVFHVEDYYGDKLKSREDLRKIKRDIIQCSDRTVKEYKKHGDQFEGGLLKNRRELVKRVLLVEYKRSNESVEKFLTYGWDAKKKYQKDRSNILANISKLKGGNSLYQSLIQEVDLKEEVDKFKGKVWPIGKNPF